MKRQCLEKWNQKTVLVLGQIDRKKYNSNQHLHLCLKNCEVALYGEGKTVKIDHVWLFTDLKEEELSYFEKTEESVYIRSITEKNLCLNLVPIVGQVHPYWRKSIRCLDYGIKYLDIYHGELNNISILIKQYKKLIEIENQVVAPLLQQKRKKIKANHKLFEQLIEYYHQFLYQNEVTFYNGKTTKLKEYIVELEQRLKSQRLVFPPDKTIAEVSEIIQTLKICFEQAEILYRKHRQNAPRFPKKTIPKTAIGFG
ncbi:hypothetical protein [Chroococcus sp. FPU101]|uniref:hypothetical protein n=1 Tax=Chroococcus sp. FPU101 TaxID=1974212 RepID=UPI001A908919|nr:hypothetical protein [Chroococcus sp. FPU101]GFE69066.1 hypothetical protein CFPU101_16760 [Chroococcus sp. FPU101]